ncbi:MAG: NYN domain-containing protein [Lachnospiraceae bacterium]|nr:NYN domain-containing protein [Lachnospiraceae bacterium]
MDKRFALLIDAENTSVKYLDTILKELREYGVVTYKRMYGDFTSGRLNEWNEKSLDYAIVPIQQPRYSKAKNAADIMLVIDAMDILYSKNADGFCIVSSDSDFTRLVNRLTEGGMTVIGMGKSDASKALKNACTEFKNLEKIYEASALTEEDGIETDEEIRKEDTESAAITPIEEIKKNILDIVLLKENQEEKAGLGGIKSQLQKAYTDFDERNYGYNSMTTFVKDMKEFEIVTEGTSVYVIKRKEQHSREEVEQYILDIVKKNATSLGSLGQKVHQRFPDFQCKNYGYTQFWRFISSIDDVEIEKKEDGRQIVKARK